MGCGRPKATTKQLVSTRIAVAIGDAASAMISAISTASNRLPTAATAAALAIVIAAASAAAAAPVAVVPAAVIAGASAVGRSEARRGGQEWVSTCGSGWTAAT